jgi:hypothetical protein
MTNHSPEGDALPAAWGRLIRLRPPLLLLIFSIGVMFVWKARPADDEATKRDKKITETRNWLTNDFIGWLTNTFPDAPSKVWPEWFVNSPSKNSVPTWLTNTFPHIDTEEFPQWVYEPDEEMIAKGIPPWWETYRKKFPIVPQAKNLPAILRGPYLQMGTTNSMMIRWRTDHPVAGVVNFGKSPDKLSKQAKAAGTLTEHVVVLTNLVADTKYYYSLGARDVPLIVHLTNNVASIGVTNGTLYVSSRSTNLELASVTNARLSFTMKLGRLSFASTDGKLKRDTTNTVLLVSTLTSLVSLSISNGALVLDTSDHILPMDGGEVGKKAKKPTKHFTVGTTNATFIGADEETHFTTHPDIGTVKPVRVWVLGDPGTRKPEEKRVRDAYYKWTADRATDLWLMLGDNAYSSGKDEEYQGSVFKVFDAMLRKSVLWPCLGNHDAGSASSPSQSGVYYDIFTLPTQGQSGGVLSGTEAYYSWDYANIHFISLDSSDSDWGENGLMVRWLKIDLQLNQQDWLVVFCHHPPYTKGSHDSDKDKDSDARMRKMREVVLPLLEQNGLDLMLTGHSHAYERSYLLDGAYSQSWNIDGTANFKSTKDGRADGTGIYTKPSRGPAPHEGAIYVVAGSSGQISGGGLQHPAMCLSLNTLGSLVLDFDGSRLDATFIDDKAVVRDYFTIKKGGGVKTAR